MSEDFVKFPSTPHLLWLGTTAARGDKVMTRAEAESFVRNPLLVEEKVDGANLGISFDGNGDLFVQNRGNFVERGTKGQFAPLWAWLTAHEANLLNVLEDYLILFGEWCYARHSVHYARLPDWFLAFDVFDRREGRFLNAGKRDEIVSRMRLATVPKVGQGVFGLNELPRLIGQSALYDGPMEGIYLRYENPSWLIQRAKVVSPGFIQQIGEHWSKQPLVPNRREAANV